MTEQLTPAHFLSYVNKPFRLPGWPHVFVLRQVDISQPDGSESKRVGRQPFNLIFQAPAGEVMREGIYNLQADDGSSFDLYLMPIHTVENDRQNYQAAFN